MRKKIHINHLGYMLGMPKTAVCITNAKLFYLINSDKGESVYAGRLSHESFDRESGDTVRIADFTDFNTPGRYYIRAGFRRSEIFEISEQPYRSLRRTVLDGIYLNRCGFDYNSSPESAARAGSFARSACHNEPFEHNGRELDLSGGWHTDSGYGRYVIPACTAAASMLYAIRLFGSSFTNADIGLITDECRWGLDWLMKMQDSSGGVYECIYSGTSGIMSSPDDDFSSYFLGAKTCRAALVFTAVTALASKCFAGKDDAYSAKLRRAAENSWIWAAQSEEYKHFIGKKGGTDPENGTAAPESEFMWAVCGMYSLTGDEFFSGIINRKYITSGFTGFGESEFGGFAALEYLLGDRKRERDTEAVIRKRITDRADRLWIADRGSGYSTARSADSGFEYGSNFHILSDCMTFILAYLLSGSQNYLMGATDQFSYIFGRNPLGISFMTGTSGDCCKSPCHSLSASTESGAAVPGMIVSGANISRSDDYSRWHIESGCPPAKCYIDSPFSTSTNVPSIHFSAPVIFISAFYDKVGRSALSGLSSKQTSQPN